MREQVNHIKANNHFLHLYLTQSSTVVIQTYLAQKQLEIGWAKMNRKREIEG